jgi:hypothetical protein
VVLREATYEEWAAERLQELGYIPTPWCDPSEGLFYEVSVMMHSSQQRATLRKAHFPPTNDHRARTANLKSQFVFGMSHPIRQSLAAVQRK